MKLITTGIILAIITLILTVINYKYPFSYTSKTVPLFEAFKSQPFISLRETLDHTKNVILVGNKSDGIQEFVEDYLNRKLHRKEPYRIFWRDVKAGYDIEFRKHPLLMHAYTYLQKAETFVMQDQTEYTRFWVLHNTEAMCLNINKQLEKFIKDHSADKILILCRSSNHKETPKPSTIINHEFQVIHFKRPQFKALLKGLTKYSVSKSLLGNIIGYYENDLSQLNHLFLNEHPIEVFRKDFQEEFEALEEVLRDDGASRLIKRLCMDGQVKSKRKEYHLNPNLVVQDDDVYLWTSIQALYAYQIRTETLCTLPSRFAQPRETVLIPQLQDIYSVNSNRRPFAQTKSKKV